MSIKTWKAEFYSKPAAEVNSTAEAVQHSLRKWRGMLPGNMEKHSVHNTTNRRTLLEDDNQDHFSMNGTTCALCQIYIIDDEWDECPDCPLNKLQGGHCSDAGKPYFQYPRTGNPKPIIELLEEIQNDITNSK